MPYASRHPHRARTSLFTANVEPFKMTLSKVTPPLDPGAVLVKYAHKRDGKLKR